MHAPFAQPCSPEHVEMTTPLQSTTFFKSAEHVVAHPLFPPLPAGKTMSPPVPPVLGELPLPEFPVPPSPPPPVGVVLPLEALHAAMDASPQTVEINSHRREFVCMFVILIPKTAHFADSVKQWSVPASALHRVRCRARRGARVAQA